MQPRDRVCPQCGALLAEREFREVSVEGENAEIGVKECPVCTGLAVEEALPPVDELPGAEDEGKDR